jgi:hypothetical protein
MDFAEGTRLVRVVPDVPVMAAGPAAHRGRGVSVVRDSRPEEISPQRADDDLTHDLLGQDGPHDLLAHDDERVRDVHPASGSPDDDRSMDALLDEVAEHDTVVLGRSSEDGETDEDPRARIPAWEDIVFGVRRHR